MSIANRIFAIAIMVVAALSLAACVGSAFAQSPPPPPELPLTAPSGLTAAPGGNPGEVGLRWTHAANADIHFVYMIEAGESDGRYSSALAGDAGSATFGGLEIGRIHWFAVIAGRSAGAGGSFRWSQWSAWASAAPASGALPPTPSPSATPRAGGVYRHAEAEGRIISVDVAANVFVMRVFKYESFGGNRPDTIAVDYGAIEYIERRLRPGLHIEAEGGYDPSGNALRAREVEIESHDDDDDGYGYYGRYEEDDDDDYGYGSRYDYDDDD